MRKLTEEYQVKESYTKRVLKSLPAFLGHYWRNTWKLIGFSVAAQIMFFILILGVDKDPFWFWVCTGVTAAINIGVFFWLLLKWRP